MHKTNLKKATETATRNRNSLLNIKLLLETGKTIFRVVFTKNNEYQY